MITYAKSRLVLYTSLTTSFRVHSSPKRVFLPRQGKASVLINLCVQNPTFIRAVGWISRTFISFQCADMWGKMCPKLNTLHQMISSVAKRTCKLVNDTREYRKCHAQKLVYLLIGNFGNFWSK